jgi:hypothetical protein
LLSFQYLGDLPGGLRFSDRREHVQQKLGTPPTSGKNADDYPDKGLRVVSTSIGSVVYQVWITRPK